MKLYLIRHGDAVNDFVDTKRPLSENGILEVETVGNLLASSETLKISHIYHSSKERAKESAEIISQCINFDGKLKLSQNLKPNDDPSSWALDLSSFEENTILVGHLPYMGILAGKLVGSENGKLFNYFPTAGILCLERSNTGSWAILRSITP